MTIIHTLHRDINGNKRAKITIEHIGAVYAEYCNGAHVDGEAALNFDAVLTYLRKRFGYRVQRKAKIPTVTCAYDTADELRAEIMDAIVYVVTGGQVEYSRVRYMYGVRRVSHHDYYVQFATPDVREYVRGMMPALLRSRKECFNDVAALTKYARLHGDAARLASLAEATTYSKYKVGGVTSSVSVCAVKAAARDELVAYIRAHDTAKKTTDIRAGVTVTEYYNGFHFELDDKVITPRDAFSLLRGHVPAMYGDVRTMICAAMILPENRDMLKRMSHANNELEATK